MALPNREIIRKALVTRAKDFYKKGNCLEWQGALHKFGYGVIRIEGTMYLVHRMVWEICHGTIPPRKVVAHRCNNKLCANPSHLYLASIEENVKDATRDGLTLRKLTKRDIVLIQGLGKSVKPGVSENYANTIIGELFKVSRQTIRKIRKGLGYNSLDLSSAVRPRIDGRAEQYKVDPIVVQPNL